MRFFYTLIVICVLADPAYCQQNDAMNYVIGREQIIIKGRTNINKFECKLDLNEMMDTLQVSVTQFNGNFDFSGLTLNIPVDAFDCKHSIMTSEFRELLRSNEYPNLSLSISNIEHLVPNKLRMLTELSVADSKNEELISECYVQNLGHELVLGGDHQIYLRSYNLEPPKKLFGAVVVKNELNISFEVTLFGKIEKEPQ